MKTKILFIRMFVLSCILFILGFTVGSCSDDDDAVLQAGYGYAQFKLYKSGLAETKKTRASTNELNYLRDAQKMKIVLIRTMVLKLCRLWVWRRWEMIVNLACEVKNFS